MAESTDVLNKPSNLQDNDLYKFLWYWHLLAFEVFFANSFIILFLVTTSVPQQWLYPIYSQIWVRAKLFWLGYTMISLELYIGVCVCLEIIYSRRPSLERQ